MNDTLGVVLAELKLGDHRWDESQYCPGVLETTIPGGEPSIRLWDALRDRYGETGYWPILRGSTLRSESPEIMNAPSPPPIAVADVLSRVPQGTVDQVVDAHTAREREAMMQWLIAEGKGDLFPEFERLGDEQDDADDEPWPEEPAPAGPLNFLAAYDILTNKPLPECGLSLIPARHPAHAPAHLGFGGWNEVPPDDVLVAIFLEWHRRYGAVPAVITSDVVEFAVDRPPLTEADAMLLAREQIKVCTDIVSQGTQSVRRLAISLWHSPQWFFWWD